MERGKGVLINRSKEHSIEIHCLQETKDENFVVLARPGIASNILLDV